ncbi:hypothetical protein OIT41_08785 [Arthrobacter sp. YA7-1]|uniref:hypothetical protein n=1 Tax=Arthrobacter sp. YA7-1 TaxID=2987701 RepID=UPI0022272C3C|nr:hypothetical protein [Arthrobacter sp. YA7-1]UYY83109.1 hypothetical protein OIT41_08785 [Arthrobacter sp. YA7-1]
MRLTNFGGNDRRTTAVKSITANPVMPRLVSEIRGKEPHHRDDLQPSHTGQKETSGTARVDKEFGALPMCLELNLAAMVTLRHHVENLLSLWCTALDAHDWEFLRDLLGNASLYVDDEPLRSDSKDMEEFLLPRPQEPVRSSRIFTNLRIWRDNDFAYYSSSVQTWTLGSEWTCKDVSFYEGRLKSGPQVWRWDQHRVRTLEKGKDAPL